MKAFLTFVIVFLGMTISLVRCGQATANRMNAMDLTTSQHINDLYYGLPVSRPLPNAAYMIWIRTASNYPSVASTVTQYNCEVFSSNYANPTFGYVTARIRCNSDGDWYNLVHNSNFYTKVAYSEKNWKADLNNDKPSRAGTINYKKDVEDLNFDENPTRDINAHKREIPEHEVEHLRNIQRQEEVARSRYFKDAEKDIANMTTQEILEFEHKKQACTLAAKAEFLKQVEGNKTEEEKSAAFAKYTSSCIDPDQMNTWTNETESSFAARATQYGSAGSYYMCGQAGEGGTVTFNCALGQILSVDWIDYGTQGPFGSTCGPGYDPGSNYGCSSRYNTAKINQVKANCVGYQVCSIPATNSFWGDPCGGKDKNLKMRVTCSQKYVLGLNPTVDSKAQYNGGNANWESNYGRSWTNYLENIGWSYSVEYTQNGNPGSFVVIDSGAAWWHPELYDPNTYAPKVTQLPNYNKGNSLVGFVDPATLNGQDPYYEYDGSHGTELAALLVGNTLGVARNMKTYIAKVVQSDTDNHGLKDAWETVYENGALTRPTVAISALSYKFSYETCFLNRQTNVPCAENVVDAIKKCHDNGIIVSISSGNGLNLFDLENYNGNYVPPCDPHPWAGWNPRPKDATDYSAVSGDLCVTATNPAYIGVGDAYFPIAQITIAEGKPWFVAAHDYFNKISRWRTIIYGINEDWTKPWYEIGNSWVGENGCVEFSAFGVMLSKSAVNYGHDQPSDHIFQSGFRPANYYISGTSYAAPLAGAVAMFAAGRYPPSSVGQPGYTPAYIDSIRNILKNGANTNVNDYDSCRTNPFYDASSLNGGSYGRLKFVW